MMSVIVEDRSGRQFVVTKGAPDVVLGQCQSLLYQNGKEAFTPKRKAEVDATLTSMASHALRTIAVAYKPLNQGETCSQASMAERQLTLVGIQGMIDPPRPEVIEAVRECKEAGIKTVMITGDHQLTACAIAQEIGIMQKYGRSLTGKELCISFKIGLSVIRWRLLWIERNR